MARPRPPTLTITITGTNDAPVAVADTNAGDAVTEAGVNPGNTLSGDPSATGNVLTNDTDVDAGDSQDGVGGQRRWPAMSARRLPAPTAR